MKGGHNRVPDSVKALRGTKRRDRSNPTAPEVEIEQVPPAPRGMTREQKAVWGELAHQVNGLGVYARSNFTAFRLMVESVTEARHPDPRDPATARVKLLQVAAGMLQRFGLDPSSRSRVSVVAPQAKDEAAGFLFGEGRPPLKAVPGGKAWASEPSTRPASRRTRKASAPRTREAVRVRPENGPRQPEPAGCRPTLAPDAPAGCRPTEETAHAVNPQ